VPGGATRAAVVDVTARLSEGAHPTGPPTGGPADLADWIAAANAMRRGTEPQAARWQWTAEALRTVNHEPIAILRWPMLGQRALDRNPDQAIAVPLAERVSKRPSINEVLASETGGSSLDA